MLWSWKFWKGWSRESEILGKVGRRHIWKRSKLESDILPPTPQPCSLLRSSLEILDVLELLSRTASCTTFFWDNKRPGAAVSEQYTVHFLRMKLLPSCSLWVSCRTTSRRDVASKFRNTCFSLCFNNSAALIASAARIIKFIKNSTSATAIRTATNFAQFPQQTNKTDKPQTRSRSFQPWVTSFMQRMNRTVCFTELPSAHSTFHGYITEL